MLFPNKYWNKVCDAKHHIVNLELMTPHMPFEKG